MSDYRFYQLSTGGIKRPVETEGKLNQFAHTPEGRLILYTIEGAFSSIGIVKRHLEQLELREQQAGQEEKRKKGDWSRGYYKELLKAEEHWIMSDEVYPFSFMWCVMAIAVDPPDLASALRAVWKKYRSGSVYSTPYKRGSLGGYKIAMNRQGWERSWTKQQVA